MNEINMFQNETNKTGFFSYTCGFVLEGGL